MDIRKIIQLHLGKKGSVRTGEIAKAANVSRVYAHRILRELQSEGEILRIGNANRARYVRANKRNVQQELAKELRFRATLHNKGLDEDLVLKRIHRETGVLQNLPAHTLRIVEYGFTEMLNNAIEHSRSDAIDVTMTRSLRNVSFAVRDRGIGVFNNIMRSRHLADELEAIQDLLKGKTTTSPDRHSGEGIFFTSKAGDRLELSSSGKRIVFENRVGDLFVRSVKARAGTLVEFTIAVKTQRKLEDVFLKYTGSELAFDKTGVTVNLYKAGKEFLSRSQARRLLAGLEKFREVTFDFGGVESIGQGFADEVFRVWKNGHPTTRFVTTNANADVQFMIDRTIHSS
jgi:hypothetical protein